MKFRTLAAIACVSASLLAVGCGGSDAESPSSTAADSGAASTETAVFGSPFDVGGIDDSAVVAVVDSGDAELPVEDTGIVAETPSDGGGEMPKDGGGEMPKDGGGEKPKDGGGG